MVYDRYGYNYGLYMWHAGFMIGDLTYHYIITHTSVVIV